MNLNELAEKLEKGAFAPFVPVPAYPNGVPMGNPNPNGGPQALRATSGDIFNIPQQQGWALNRQPAGLRPGFASGEYGNSMDPFESCEQHDGVCTDCTVNEQQNYAETQDCPPNTAGNPCRVAGFVGVFQAGFCGQWGTMCCVRPNDDLCQANGGICLKLPPKTTGKDVNGLACKISVSNTGFNAGFYVKSMCPSKPGFACCRPVNDNLCEAMRGLCTNCLVKAADGSCFQTFPGAPDYYRSTPGGVCSKVRPDGQAVGGVFVPGMCPSSMGFMCCTETPNANPLTMDVKNVKRASDIYNTQECAAANGRCTPCTAKIGATCNLLFTGTACTQQLDNGFSRPGIFSSGKCEGFIGFMCCISSVGMTGAQLAMVGDKCLAQGGWCTECQRKVAGICVFSDNAMCTAAVPGMAPLQGKFKEGLCFQPGKMCCIPLQGGLASSQFSSGTSAFELEQHAEGDGSVSRFEHQHRQDPFAMHPLLSPLFNPHLSKERARSLELEAEREALMIERDRDAKEAEVDDKKPQTKAHLASLSEGQEQMENDRLEEQTQIPKQKPVMKQKRDWVEHSEAERPSGTKGSEAMETKQERIGQLGESREEQQAMPSSQLGQPPPYERSPSEEPTDDSYLDPRPQEGYATSPRSEEEAGKALVTLEQEAIIAPPEFDKGCFTSGGWCIKCPNTMFGGFCYNTKNPCQMQMSPNDPPTIGDFKSDLCSKSKKGFMCCISRVPHPGNPYSGSQALSTISADACEAQDGVCVERSMAPNIVGTPCSGGGFVGFYRGNLCKSGYMCCVRPNDDLCQARGGVCIKKSSAQSSDQFTPDMCQIASFGTQGVIPGKWRPKHCPNKAAGTSCCVVETHPSCAVIDGRCVACPKLGEDGKCQATIPFSVCMVQFSSFSATRTGAFVPNLCPNTPGFMCCSVNPQVAGRNQGQFLVSQPPRVFVDPHVLQAFNWQNMNNNLGANQADVAQSAYAQTLVSGLPTYEIQQPQMGPPATG